MRGSPSGAGMSVLLVRDSADAKAETKQVRGYTMPQVERRQDNEMR